MGGGGGGGGLLKLVLNFYSDRKIVINLKCLEKLLESRIPSIVNLYEVAVKLEGAKVTKSKDLETTTAKDSTKHGPNNEKNGSAINPEACKKTFPSIFTQA